MHSVHEFIWLFVKTQYVFIHTALDELITCGETEVAAANVRIAIGRLGRIAASNSITGFQQQYEVSGAAICLRGCNVVQ